MIKKYGNSEHFKSLIFAPSQPKSKQRTNSFIQHQNLRTIETSKTGFDENHSLYNKYCVFTGELEKYSREEATQIIVDLGGKCENNITKKTNYLILSAAADPNKKTGKQKKAEEYKLKGQNIEIISENVFYDMINEE